MPVRLCMRQGQQVEQVFLGVPGSQDRTADLLGQRLRVVNHRVELAAHASGPLSGSAGYAVPAPGCPCVRDALAPGPSPAADLGERGVGELNDEEVIHNQNGVRQRGAHSRFVDRAPVDGPMADPLASTPARARPASR